MSDDELHRIIASPPRRELRALLSSEVPIGDLSEEGPARMQLVHRRMCRLRNLKQVAGLALGSLALALIAKGTTSLAIRQHSRGHSAKEMFAGNPEVQLAAMTDELACHTADAGERCHSDVVWAMRNWKVHPEWYIGLNNCSDFHDFQSFMHTQILNSGARRCPKPCEEDKRTPPKGKKCKVKKEVGDCHTAVPGEDCYAHMIYTQSEAVKYPHWYPGITKESSMADVQYYLHTERVCPKPCTKDKLKKEDNITGCHSARPGDTCFADILLAKDKFIEKHPSWYKGLTQNSSNDEFQAFLYDQKHEGSKAEKKACPTPCNKTAMDAIDQELTCKTAEVGDACYESVLWGATIGIQTHPLWYAGLTRGSPFEDFQAHLHRDNHTKCHDLPCPCHDLPKKGSACYDTMLWVFDDGLKAHPHRFKGLSMDSSLQEVQQRLHELRTSACGRPCKTFDEDNRSPWRQTRAWM